YSLRDVVHGVISAVEPLAAEKRLDFKAEVAPDLPAGRGDERRLSQVLLNLVGNAIKFTDKGEVAIRASLTNGAFTVTVCDTGPGIALADQAKIFEEFQLPVLAGYEATRRLKADAALRAIPVIAVTSHSLSGDADKARAAGCDAYISKPYSPRQLLAKVREYLSPIAPTR